MQIPSIPPPLITNPLPQDLVAKAVPHVHAATPLEQRAVSASPESEKSHQNRSNKDKNKGGNREKSHNRDDDDPEDKNKERGSAVNIDV